MNLRQARQFALARGLAVKSSIASFEALEPLDPLARRLVARQVRRLLARAERATALREPGHLLALAYLFGEGAPVADADEAAAVREQAAALPAPGSLGGRGRWLTPVALLSLLALGLGIALGQRLRRPFAPAQTAAGQLLGAELTRAVVAASKRDASELELARGELTGARAEKALGTSAAHELAGLLVGMSALRSTEPDGARPLVEAYLANVAGLNRALEQRALPFFVDGELHTTERELQALPMSYYVQREARLSDGASNVRALWLWRLDQLNVHQGMLGFTRPNTPAAIILLDQLETDLVQYVLPGAAPDGRVELVDERTREKGEPWAQEIEARAAELVRGYFRALPIASDAARIGSLLSQRRSLVRKWQAALRGQGLLFAIPYRLFPEADYAAELELRIPRAELEQWDDVHAELRARVHAFEELRDRYARGVERHEVQHRLDYGRGLIAVPPLLCRLLGLESPIAEDPTSLAARARDEASAYLAELGRDEDSPLLELVILSHFMLDREMMGSPYTFAALEVYAAIGTALGLDLDTLIGTGSISRQGFSRLALAIWAHTPDELKRAAVKGFETDYGMPLPVLKRVSARDNVRYRP